MNRRSQRTPRRQVKRSKQCAGRKNVFCLLLFRLLKKAYSQRLTSRVTTISRTNHGNLSQLNRSHHRLFMKQANKTIVRLATRSKSSATRRAVQTSKSNEKCSLESTHTDLKVNISIKEEIKNIFIILKEIAEEQINPA